jgi:hypothetical protein
VQDFQTGWQRFQISGEFKAAFMVEGHFFWSIQRSLIHRTLLSRSTQENGLLTKRKRKASTWKYEINFDLQKEGRIKLNYSPFIGIPARKLAGILRLCTIKGSGYYFIHIIHIVGVASKINRAIWFFFDWMVLRIKKAGYPFIKN